MIDKQRVTEIIFEEIDEINRALPEERQLLKELETKLLGKTGKLDSLGLVTLIVAIEQRLEDETGVPIIIADEKALSQRTSPFRTVKTLAEYIIILIREFGYEE